MSFTKVILKQHTMINLTTLSLTDKREGVKHVIMSIKKKLERTDIKVYEQSIKEMLNMHIRTCQCASPVNLTL